MSIEPARGENAAKVTRIAHIGDTGTDFDSQIRIRAIGWLLQFIPDLLDGEIVQDSIDLNADPPRDFLTERRKYEIVILHYIANPPGSAPRYMLKGVLNTSLAHCWSNWQKRLINTGAKVIIAVGGLTEVSGQYLARIPGYDRIDLSSGMSVFTKHKEISHARIERKEERLEPSSQQSRHRSPAERTQATGATRRHTGRTSRESLELRTERGHADARSRFQARHCQGAR